MESWTELLTSPVHAQGMEAAMRRTPIRIRAPYLSHIGPLMNRLYIGVNEMGDVRDSDKRWTMNKLLT